jgi:hypothetical protein
VRPPATRRIVLTCAVAAVSALVAFGLLHNRGAAASGPIDVRATSISSFNTVGFGTSFGPFEWRGGINLTSSDWSFGGLSGLVLTDDCESLLSVSDRGNWFSAKLSYDKEMLSGLKEPMLAPVLDRRGGPPSGWYGADAEALADLGGGRIGVAFERRVRFGSYAVGARGLQARFTEIPFPKDISNGPENGEVEAFGLLPSGEYIAIAERQRDKQGNTRAWIWKDGKTTAFSIERYGAFNVTDLAVLPDGKVLTVERRFNRSSLPAMAVRRFDPSAEKAGETVKPELLLEASVPFHAIDNMEGIAICTRDGETRVTFQSDNNFNALVQSTLLLQFAYKP